MIYMSPHVPLSLLPEIQAAFAITTEPLLRYDNSRHYRCYLDAGWGGEGEGNALLLREEDDIMYKSVRRNSGAIGEMPKI